jgi:hypothetical protein
MRNPIAEAACSLPQPVLLLLLIDWIYGPAQKEHGHHIEMPDMHLLIATFD